MRLAPCLGLVLLLIGCGPARQPTAAEFEHRGQVVPGVWLHADWDLSQQERDWCEESLTDPDGHFWTWWFAFGTRNLQRETHVYAFRDLPVDPVRGYSSSDDHGYLVEDLSTPGAPRDELWVSAGPKGVLPGVMLQLHQASCWPRDYWRQDPANDWHLILGYTQPAGQATGLQAGPSNVVNLQTGQAQHVPGLQEQVVNRLLSRR